MEFLPGEIGHVQVRKSEQKQAAGLKLEQRDDGTVTVRKISDLFKRRNTGIQAGDEVLKLNGIDVPGGFADLNAMKLLVKREVLIEVTFRRPYPESEDSEKNEEVGRDGLEVEDVQSSDDDDDDESSSEEEEEGHAIVPYRDSDSDTDTDRNDNRHEIDGALVPYDAKDPGRKPSRGRSRTKRAGAVVPYKEGSRRNGDRPNKETQNGKSNASGGKPSQQSSSVVPYGQTRTPKKTKKTKEMNSATESAPQDRSPTDLALISTDTAVATAAVVAAAAAASDAIAPGQLMKLKNLKAKAEFNGSFVKVLRHAGGSRWEVEVMACPDAVFLVNANKLEPP